MGSISFHDLIDSVPFGVLVCNQGGQINYVNHEICSIFGYSRSELNDKHISILIPHSLRSGHERLHHEFLLLPKARRMGSGRDLLALRKNGDEFFAEIALLPLSDDAGSSNIVVTIIDVSYRKRIEESLRYQCLHDDLTSLPNRTLFLDRLDQHCRQYERQLTPFAVAILDLNGFKKANDTFGHPVGDAILDKVGKRLVGAIRKTDTVARLGGDEFGILYAGVKDESGATRLISDVMRYLKAPFSLDFGEVFIGASAGVVLCPINGINAERLIKQADHAMYQAKRNGSRFANDGCTHHTFVIAQ